MKLVPLTNIHKTKVNAPRRYFARVSDRDFERVSALNWYASRERGNVYAARDDGATTVRLSRFLLGISDSKVEVQCLDGDGLNCTRGNLRVGTHNVTNHRRAKKSGCSSEYRGVSWFSRRDCWRAVIKVRGKQIHLGYYDSEKEAAREFDKAARFYYGSSFYKLNFVRLTGQEGT